MDMHVTNYQGRTTISVLRLVGKLDATSYLSVIEKAKHLVHEGTRQMILDMSGVTYLSSAGLMALHTITVLLRGGTPADPEAGWSALHAAADDINSGGPQPLKLLNPQPTVLRTLEHVNFTDFIETFTNLDDAISSFSPLADRSDQSQRQLRYMQAANPELAPKPTKPDS